MLSIEESYKKSFEYIKEGIANLLLITVSQSVITMAIGGFLYVGTIFLSVVVSILFSSVKSSQSSLDFPINFLVTLLILLLTIFLYIIILLVSTLAQGALVYVLDDVRQKSQKSNMLYYVKKAWNKKWSILGANILIGLIGVVGTLFFIIPGVLAAIFLSLTIHIHLLEKKDITTSMKMSYERVKSNFFPYVGRLALMMLLIIVLMIVTAIIPFAGLLVQLIAIPFISAYSFVLYENLKKESNNI